MKQERQEKIFDWWKKVPSRLGEGFLNLLYPKTCILCAEPLGNGAKDWLVCEDCVRLLPYVKEPTCFHCGKPILSDQEEFCRDCKEHPFHYEQGFAVFVYDDCMQKAVAQFKYENRRELGTFFAKEMAKKYQKKLSSLPIEALIPVPIHPKRRRFRGYNQAEILSEALSRETGIKTEKNLLLRNKKTLPQKELDASSRLQNLETAFEINSAIFSSSIASYPFENASFEKLPTSKVKIPKIVALIDDIYTTGSTAEAATKVLLRAGVEKVYLFNLCIGTEK